MTEQKEIRLRVLFLDDDSMRHDMFTLNHAQDGVEIVQSWTAVAAIKCLNDDPKYDLVFLDHDLADWHYGSKGYGEAAGTGMDVVDYMCKDLPKEKHPDHIIVHSWNYHRGHEMTLRLKEAGFKVTRSEFEGGRTYFKAPPPKTP